MKRLSSVSSILDPEKLCIIDLCADEHNLGMVQRKEDELRSLDFRATWPDD